MNRISHFALDYYNKAVIREIINKYAMSEMDAANAFLTSQTHAMLENADMAMWEFSAHTIFDIWENEQITGNPRNSVYLRSEL